MDRVAKRVLSACLDVHKILGPGFLENIYERALAIEFERREIKFERQKIIDVYYKGFLVGKGKIDFFVENSLVIELKTVDAFHNKHIAQMISYLRATNNNLGLIINFNVAILKQGIKRVILTKES